MGQVAGIASDPFSFFFGAIPVAKGVAFLVAQSCRRNRRSRIRKVGDKGRSGEGAGEMVARAWSITGWKRVRKRVRGTAGARKRRDERPQARGLGGLDGGRRMKERKVSMRVKEEGQY